MSDDPVRRPKKNGGDALCSGCGAPKIAPDQRYCLVCGTRSMALPPVIAGWLERVRSAAKGEAAPAKPDASEEGAGEAADGDPEGDGPNYMPTPQAAAVAVMALLAFGVIVGSLTQQLAQSAGLTTVVLGNKAAAPATPEVTEREVEEVAPAPATAPTPAPAPTPAEPEVAPEEEAPAEAPPPKAPPELPPEPTLPPISHVFLIVLGEQGYEDTFGAASQSTYFSTTLPAQGELLSNYYAVAPSGLANEIALLSGQGPTRQTAADCPEYNDLASATVGLMEQVEGEGCVYPAETETLPGQLSAAKLTWKAYVEENGEPGQPPTCLHAWRDPFAYFHSLVDGGECEQRDVGLEGLSADLANAKRTPSLSYIVADACHDGSDTPCAPGQPAGLSGAESFLQTVVPEIEKSPAYAVGGLIAITFSGAPQSGPKVDPSSCCATPEYPNLKDPTAPPAEPAVGPVKPTGGGGRVGMLLISPYVLPGSVNETSYYNHFSTLLSLEELFSLPPLGYAGEAAITPFDESVYNNQES